MPSVEELDDLVVTRWHRKWPEDRVSSATVSYLITRTSSWKALSTFMGGSLALVSIYVIWKAKQKQTIIPSYWIKQGLQYDPQIKEYEVISVCIVLKPVFLSFLSPSNKPIIPSPHASLSVWCTKTCSWFIFSSGSVKTCRSDGQSSTIPTIYCLAAHTSGSIHILDWVPAATGPKETSYLHYASQPFLGPVQSWLFSDGPNPLYLPPAPSGKPPWEEVIGKNLNNTFSIPIQGVKNFWRMRFAAEKVLKWSSAKYGHAASCMETFLFLFYLKTRPYWQTTNAISGNYKAAQISPAGPQSCFGCLEGTEAALSPVLTIFFFTL